MQYQANKNNECDRLGKLAHAFLLQTPCSRPYCMPGAGKLKTTHPGLPYSSDMHRAAPASRHTHAKFSSLCCLFWQVHSWRHFGEIIIDGPQLHRQQEKEFRANHLLVRVTAEAILSWSQQLWYGCLIIAEVVASLVTHFCNGVLETFHESPAHSLFLQSFQGFCKPLGL